MTSSQKKKLARIIISAVLLVAAAVIPADGILKLIFFLIPYFIVGYDILIKAVKGIINLQPFDECFLMVTATVGAIALREYTEGVAVMLFYQIGELFESYAVGKSRRNIAALMDIRPDTARLEHEDGSIEEVSPEDIPVGSIIVLLPGDRVPLDGTVIEGNGTLDTAALTGESAPRDVGVGDGILSGCINLNTRLRIRTSCVFGESTVARVLELVENASSRKSRSENFISRFARIYTPAVVFSALALFLLPPLISMVIGADPRWADWLYRALTFLVISCPCALVISIPLTFFAGIGCASSAGVLIKGSNYMETLAGVRTVVFDKTGTLTRGIFDVTSINPVDTSPDALLEYAALAESGSTHPIAQSILRAYGKAPDTSRVHDVREVSGRGITALIDGVAVALGNARMMRQIGLEPAKSSASGTAIHVAVNGTYAGYILISDTVKPTSPAAIEAVKKNGVRRVIMLTGDTESAAKDIAETLGIDEYYAGLLPEDKVKKVEELIGENQSGDKLAFVGDGINDAPVLTRADVGIAMGAMGSDAAIEAADVVLMDDDPLKIVRAVAVSRKCLKIVYENIWFAIGVKLICLLLSAIGIANMWLAIFADVGVMVIAVLNAVRALKLRGC